VRYARKWPVAAGLALLLALASWLARPELVETAPEETSIEPTPALIAKGEYLARAGNCIACHTAPGQAPYAGGRAIATPFGAVYSTNLTPDPETGLGNWSAADFWRAMHYGKSRDGRRLYPAFPYTSYTHVTREDADAIFAFLRSLEPVPSPRIEADIGFPYNTQLAQIVWRALYFRPGGLEPDPARSPEWNRGAYLVEGLGHCSVCHTRRTPLGGEDASARYVGGSIPMLGWDAPPLAPTGPLSDEEAAEMAEVLKAGTSAHGVASGPMAEVVFHSLQYLDDADIAAIVEYVRALPPPPPRTRGSGPVVASGRAEQLVTLGASLYREHCADCHGADGKGEPYVYPALAGNPLVTSPSPANLLATVRLGGYAPSTAAHPRPYGMPPYAQQLSAEEIAAVASYVRRAWGNGAPAVSPTLVRERR